MAAANTITHSENELVSIKEDAFDGFSSRVEFINSITKTIFMCQLHSQKKPIDDPLSECEFSSVYALYKFELSLRDEINPTIDLILAKLNLIKNITSAIINIRSFSKSGKINKDEIVSYQESTLYLLDKIITSYIIEFTIIR